MQNIDITSKVKNYIRFGLVGAIILSMAIGYGEFKYWHRDELIVLDDAKVAGTMVSVRVLTNGKVSELVFEDGAEVKAGEVIARLEVAITEDEIRQLEETVQLAKDNYAELQAGQTVMVPVQRERVIYQAAPPPTVHYSQAAPPANLAALEERANRMAELFEMGAVSAVQRDAAQRAYESALAESQSSTATYEYNEAPAPIVEYYTEYVEEFRPTPPEVLDGAAQAIRQAELSLNIARQEARETDVIAPVSGTIYYGVEVEQDLSAGESLARVGDSRELWIEVAVSEELFNKIPLGKLVSYTIDGRELFGTVMEKIEPTAAPTEETPLELPDIPTSDNAPAPLIGNEQPDETPPADEQTESSEETPPAENQADDAEQPQVVEAEVETVEEAAPAEDETPAEDEPSADTPPQPPSTPKFLNGTESQPKPNDQFIIKISLPAERDFNCHPNTPVTVKVKI